MTMMLARFLAVLVLGLAGSVHAADPAIERANEEAFRGKHEAAFAILRPMAERGDPDAQYALAKIQLTEHWRMRDPADGRKWLQRAAEQNHQQAQLDLGVHHATETKDFAEARKWYLKAAERLDTPAGRMAAENLGVIHAQGQGVPSSYAEAASWYRKSAERGGARGQFALGLILLEGLAGQKDFAEGVKWLGAAARQKHEQARYTLILLHAEGFDTRADPVEAAYWVTGRRLSDAGEAAYQVGRFYMQGFFAWPENQQVLAWLLHRRGIAANVANDYLKRIYSQRWGDEDAALRWYRAGAEAGFIGAQVNLAGIHWNAESPHWNCAEAARWTRAAADRSDGTAMVNMAFFYANGPKERVLHVIGVELETFADGVLAKAVAPGSAAEAAGVKAGDLILEVNGEDTRKRGAEAIVEKVRASRGKEVALRLLRRGEMQPRAIAVTPREVRTPCPGAEASGLKRDPVEAVRWYEKAAERGNLTGLFHLAGAYRNGNGVPKDPRRAMELYERGVDRGDWEAAQALSHMHAAGEAGEKNKELAERWFRRAVELRHRAVGR